MDLIVDRQVIVDKFKCLQDKICSCLELADGRSVFTEDLWKRDGGGGGRSRTIADGFVIEKGGVGFSEVFGKTPEKILKALQFVDADFFATGVSLVMHPQNPFVPIIHMNVRYFEMSNGVWWFGGGIDLTPHYVDLEEAKWFHQKLKNTCDQYHVDFYPRFKKWADDYFFLKHRNETRGIGGIFFDRLNENEGLGKETLLNFVEDVCITFCDIYPNLMNKNASREYDQSHVDWQLRRRSRYVEFNLVWDAGTKFGLDTDGRTESILMSMPPLAKWEYNHQPDGQLELNTLNYLKKGIDWLNII